MSEDQTLNSGAQHEVIQAVVDRVSSYQDAAPEVTIEQELRKGLAEAGVDVQSDDVALLVDAIEKRDGDGDVDSLLS